MRLSTMKKKFPIWGLVLAIFLQYYFHWGSLDAFVIEIDSCDSLFCDFTRYYYPMGKKLLDNPVPTEGFYYSPVIAQVFSLWRFQSKAAAVVSWGVVQIAAVILLIAVWMRSIQKQKFSLRLLYLFLVLTAMPVVHNFKWGQISIIVTLSILLALELYEAGRKIPASFLLAFSALFKFYPVVFLFYFLWTGDLLFLILCGFFFLLLGVALPALTLGLKPTISFYFAILDSAGTRFSFATGKLPGVNSLYFPLVAMRYFGEFNNPAWLLPLQIVGWLILGANAFLVLLVAASNLEHRLRWAFLLMLASTPFFISSLWAHYFVYLPAFQLFLAFVIERDRKVYWKYPLLAVSVVLSSVFFMQLFDVWRDYAYWGFLTWSNLLLLVLAYAELIPKLSLREGLAYYRKQLRSMIRIGNYQ
jgi:hypothetical protein